MSLSVPVLLQSAWLHQNAGFSLYSPDCEARRHTGPKVRETRRHPGSAEDRRGRQTLPGGAVPVRLRTTSCPADQLAYVRRCSVLRMRARPTQIPAEAVPGLRGARHDPARPPELLPARADTRWPGPPGRPQTRPITYGTSALRKPAGPPAVTPVLIAVNPLKTGRRSIPPAATSGADSSHGAGNATATMTVQSARVTLGPSSATTR